MTKNSGKDLAWVRPGKERSGTSRNLARRKLVEENESMSLSELYMHEAMEFI